MEDLGWVTVIRSRKRAPSRSIFHIRKEALESEFGVVEFCTFGVLV